MYVINRSQIPQRNLHLSHMNLFDALTAPPVISGKLSFVMRQKDKMQKKYT